MIYIYIADMYSRDRILSIQKKVQNDPSVAEWARTNKHCLELKSIIIKTKDNIHNAEKSKTSATTAYDMAVSGIESFFGRISPKLLFTPSKVIDYSLEDACKYIGTAVKFVAKEARQKEETCPFQYDAVFAFGKIITDVINDDDDDDEDAKEYKMDVINNNLEGDGHTFDCFGNVSNQLTKYKLFNITNKIDDDMKTDMGFVSTIRAFGETFRKFKIEYKKRAPYKLKDYPRRYRFCSLLDLRKPENNNNDDIKENNKYNISNKDEIIFYDLPKGTNKFPNNVNHSPLFYFDRSRRCIIPGEQVKNSNQEKQKYREKIINANKTSLTSCNGAMMVLSFHVESTDEIRCYLYLHGQICRFLPSDIIHVLPIFFIQNEKNKKYAKSPEIKKLANSMENELRGKNKNIYFAFILHI